MIVVSDGRMPSRCASNGSPRTRSWGGPAAVDRRHRRHPLRRARAGRPLLVRPVRRSSGTGRGGPTRAVASTRWTSSCSATRVSATARTSWRSARVERRSSTRSQVPAVPPGRRRRGGRDHGRLRHPPARRLRLRRARAAGRHRRRAARTGGGRCPVPASPGEAGGGSTSTTSRSRSSRRRGTRRSTCPTCSDAKATTRRCCSAAGRSWAARARTDLAGPELTERLTRRRTRPCSTRSRSCPTRPS